MYLTARKNLYKFDKKQEKLNQKMRKLFPEMFESDNLNTVGVTFEAGYWRKANAIHKWFVENCQDGRDECQSSYVSRKKLEELRELCKKVLKILLKQKPVKTKWKDQFGQDRDELLFKDTKEIEKLLPTCPGFFFGSYEYDKWYKTDLENTIKIINKCLELPDNWLFEYHSSW